MIDAIRERIPVIRLPIAAIANPSSGMREITVSMMAIT